MMLPLIDTHAHLEMLVDVEKAVQRAKAVGVTAVVAVGSNPESNIKVYEISRRHAGYVYPAFGLHPWDLPSFEKEGLRFLAERINQCSAVGEVGLDYWIKVDKSVQDAVLQQVLSLARAASKPVLIHSRGAWAEALEAVEKSSIRQALFHWFSGPPNVLRGVLDKGFLISATPAAAYSKAHREAIRLTPLENIMLETDSPVKYGGVESEPAHLPRSLKAVAELKEVSEDLAAEKTTQNANRFFGMRLGA